MFFFIRINLFFRSFFQLLVELYCLPPFKGRSACISNKSRVAYIWVFYLYLRRKKLGKQSVDCIWRKKVPKESSQKTSIISIVLLSSIENSNIHNSNKTLHFIILFFLIQINVIKNQREVWSTWIQYLLKLFRSWINN